MSTRALGGIAMPQTSTIVPVLVTVDEAAHMLRVSRRTVYELINSAQLRRVKLGKCSRIPYDDVRSLIERNAL